MKMDESFKNNLQTEVMYRLYNPYTGEHFYTADKAEKEHLAEVGWNYEGVAWTAPTKGKPVYRLYNPYVSDYHYTTDIKERDWLWILVGKMKVSAGMENRISIADIIHFLEQLL